jgi:hypothetical protein
VPLDEQIAYTVIPDVLVILNPPRARLLASETAPAEVAA